jgi:hypothetical protein
MGDGRARVAVAPVQGSALRSASLSAARRGAAGFAYVDERVEGEMQTCTHIYAKPEPG